MVTNRKLISEPGNFEQFYITQQKIALKYLIGKGLSEEAAFDIFQNSIIAFWEKSHCTPGQLFDSQSAAYLFGIYRNQANTYFRAASRHPHCSFEETLGTGSDTSFADSTNLVSSSELAEAMAYLSEKEREILNLYYWEGFSMAQIAEQLGYKSETVVKSQKCRAMKELKQLLASPAPYREAA